MSLPRTRIKICGMTRPADARCAVEAGVDALGFIFHPKSPRNIEPEAARAIIQALPPFVDAVGVVVDKPLAEVVELARFCGLQYAQLHGKESPEYCRSLAQEAAPCKMLKVFRVGPQTTAEELAPYGALVSGYLLDTYQKGVVGGTGAAFDWSLIRDLDIQVPLVLAGGLDADNISQALHQVRPYGVDANSGLEDAPGKKNHALIRKFIRAVRAFDQASPCSASQE